MSSDNARGTARDMPPPAIMRQMMAGYRVTQALYVAAKLGVADLLKDEPKTSSELATSLGVHSDLLQRVLRLLASLGVFTEVEDGRFTLTPLAALLQSDVPGSMRALAILEGEWYEPAWSALLNSVNTGSPGFEQVFGMKLFPYLAQHPHAAEVYNAAMAGATIAETLEIPAAYDFSDVQTLVDVGGGQGALLATILTAHPHVRGVLLDQPAVIESARRVLEANGVWSRCTLVAGDFFVAVPVGGDVYVLKWVLHDWDDEDALRILRTCRRAMGQQAKLLVMEKIIPAKNEPSYAQLSDLNMFILYGGRERTEREYRRLLATAGFTLTRVIPTSAPAWNRVSVIEGTPA